MGRDGRRVRGCFLRRRKRNGWRGRQGRCERQGRRERHRRHDRCGWYDRDRRCERHGRHDQYGRGERHGRHDRYGRGERGERDNRIGRQRGCRWARWYGHRRCRGNRRDGRRGRGHRRNLAVRAVACPRQDLRCRRRLRRGRIRGELLRQPAVDGCSSGSGADGDGARRAMRQRLAALRMRRHQHSNGRPIDGGYDARLHLQPGRRDLPGW